MCNLGDTWKKGGKGGECSGDCEEVQQLTLFCE